ncbi:MAG: D-2-hydroxyacid dehydrogenase [Flavobacteriales bacterium]
MKVLANDGISASGEAKLKEYGYEVITDFVPQDELVSYINSNEVAALLVRSATKVRTDIIDNCPSLKFIGRGGVGMDNIDVDYARSKGITVNNTPAASSQSVAELVIAQMFSISRFTHLSNKEMPENGSEEFKTLKKKYGKGVELRGKTLGIIGFGRIGKSLAKYALGCGMKVVAYDRNPIENSIELEFYNGQKVNVDVENATFDEIIETSDYLSLHVPKQDDGSAVLSQKEFDKMKPSIRIVNAARGGVINEDDLLTAIEKKQISYCALDVFENEPNPRKDLLTNPFISTTPHIGAATLEAQDRIGTEMAEKVNNTLKLQYS